MDLSLLNDDVTKMEKIKKESAMTSLKKQEEEIEPD